MEADAALQPKLDGAIIDPAPDLDEARAQKGRRGFA
jgi:hypothetical protein